LSGGKATAVEKPLRAATANAFGESILAKKKPRACPLCCAAAKSCATV